MIVPPPPPLTPAPYSSPPPPLLRPLSLSFDFFSAFTFAFSLPPFFYFAFTCFETVFVGSRVLFLKIKTHWAPSLSLFSLSLSLFPLQSMVFIDNFTFTSNQRRNAMDAPPYTLVLSRMFPFLKCSTVCPTFEALDTGQLVPLVFRQSSFFSSSACICVFQTKTSALLSMCTQTSDL